MKMMKTPEDITEVNFEGMHYPIDENGCVALPDHAALTLYQFGFVNAEKTPHKPSKKAV